jgi:uncharacterized protein
LTTHLTDANAGSPPVVDPQADVLKFLSQPETYGIATDPVRIDTHVSIVFLAGDYAYKMKRAVRYTFLDFSTLEKRRSVCEAEIALNRPNAPDIYVGTVPVVRGANGLALGGDGEVVEWLVRMRRFDPANTLDHVAERGALSDKIISDLVAAISRLHENAAVGDGAAATDRLMERIRGNIEELQESSEIVPPEDTERLLQTSEAEYERRRDLLLARGAAGFVRRCHGDLHLRNIVLIDGRPVLFDALEFNDAFATHDIFYDLAFLLMDLWHRDMHAEANRVRNLYLWLNAEPDHIDGCALFPLFMSMRAAVRAKVAFSTAKVGDPARARSDVAEGRGYFAWARGFLADTPPILIAVGGLSGSGKTTASAALAPGIGRPPGALHLRSDVERKRMFNVADTDRLPASAYSEAVGEEVYARLRDKACRALRAGESAVVDAVHARPAERAAIAEVARAKNVPFVGLWLDAPHAMLLERVCSRTGDASDADAAVVKRQLSFDTGSIGWHRIDTTTAGHIEHARAVLGNALGR